MLPDRVIREAIRAVPGDYARWYDAFTKKHGREPSQQDKLDYVTGKDMLKGLSKTWDFMNDQSLLFKRLYERKK